MAKVAVTPPTGHTMHDQCPHDKAALVVHDTEDKDAATFGALHCSSCGCCFKQNGKLREQSATCEAIDAESTEFVKLDD
jgi:phenylpropionate dioxygenase-like ring-hydroxylating dioxygenase large terminal subunit